ncbi:helix-turn-helix domain-containing protein [Pallidibacillus pasinlerensis]|uniref:Helix-turn-helix domain-containing protein n=1 Tax=Pallidibacillus pasinlerensis TaxID=2703818 RepID=A0ABX0A945_9BACI|nr:helix-turn-helix domain-containing protein [Pallidibacillus pasinlerensis]NCU18584.1 helix-turn-helix domain-containing protein [Pallidibacillus pasinlerensis]
MKRKEGYPVALDVSHIQSILGIGRRQAYDLVNSGQFHVVRIGKRIKVSREVFFNWLNGGEE